jgi:hypothetical protein
LWPVALKLKAEAFLTFDLARHNDAGDDGLSGQAYRVASEFVQLAGLFGDACDIDNEDPRDSVP